MSSALLYLRSRDSKHGYGEVVIDPTQGARIIRYAHIDNQDVAHHWFMPAVDGDGGCFVMVPFCSRVQYGQFVFGGQAVELDVSRSARPHAIHGHGMRKPWRVVEQAASRIELAYEIAGADWPWPYQVKMIVQLQGLRLQIKLEVENMAASEMPLGVGVHPYFPLDADTRVQAKVQQCLLLDDELMPVAVQPTSKELDLSQGITPAQLDLDQVFLGWSGTAKLAWPNRARALHITATAPCEHLVLFSPAEAGFVCVEPVSNVPNGFNTDLEIQPRHQVLTPGELLSAQWTFEPEFIEPDQTAAF